MIRLLFIFGWLISLISGIYLWVVAIAGIRERRVPQRPAHPRTRFAIAIPAHNEESVIGDTVRNLMQLSYPRELFDVFVVADFCTDRTAQIASQHGASCYLRNSGLRGGKGAALNYLFERIFDTGIDYDAVVVFDADTQVDSQFLQVADAHLGEGADIIQGQHVIANPRDGWFPALTWTMMTIDNRFSNQGRTNLGLSAKHMGDSICFRTGVLKRIGWGGGLTEDYELRLRLLLDGSCIEYEPHALGHGQAPRTWKEAQAQRLRWAKGMADAGKQYRNRLLREGIQQRDWRKLDGALSTLIPSYSTLAFVSSVFLLVHLLLPPKLRPLPMRLWAGLVMLFVAYPMWGLGLVRAPIWAYAATMSGPLFILWRSWLNLRVRLTDCAVQWVRTPHQSTRASNE